MPRTSCTSTTIQTTLPEAIELIEEISEAEARAQFETNVFGALWVTQAALPILREQGAGHILQVSSIGEISAFGGIGAYHASKWALEGLSQALAQEVGGERRVRRGEGLGVGARGAHGRRRDGDLRAVVRQTIARTA